MRKQSLIEITENGDLRAHGDRLPNKLASTLIWQITEKQLRMRDSVTLKRRAALSSFITASTKMLIIHQNKHNDSHEIKMQKTSKTFLNIHKRHLKKSVQTNRQSSVV